MSSVHRNLVLDHFFISASEEQFEELKTIFLKFQCTNHQVVKADDDSWEGLYVYTRSQYYFEILRTRRPNCAGVCQKAYNPLQLDTRKITEDFPHLPWKTFERSIAGAKWFTALSCDNYLDLTTPFNTWVMHYYPFDRSLNYHFKKYEIQTISQCELDADPALIDRIKLNSSWFHAEKTEGENEITFDFKTYYSDPMQIKINLQPGTTGLTFRKLKFSVAPDIEGPNFADLNLKYYRINKAGSDYELEVV